MSPFLFKGLLSVIEMEDGRIEDSWTLDYLRGYVQQQRSFQIWPGGGSTTPWFTSKAKDRPQFQLWALCCGDGLLSPRLQDTFVLVILLPTRLAADLEMSDLQFSLE